MKTIRKIFLSLAIVVMVVVLCAVAVGAYAYHLFGAGGAVGARAHA